MVINGMIMVVTGLLAGLLGGLLGIGGGIVLMPVLRFVLGLSPAESAGTCVVAVFFTTLGGGIKHGRLGHVPLRMLWPVIISGALATLAFSVLFSSLAQHGQLLDVGIGSILLFLSLFMMYDALRFRRPEPESDLRNAPLPPSSIAKKSGLGMLAGVLPGLFGIGTGAVLVPGFVYALKMPVKWAIGSALVCFSANALISALMKIAQGYTLVAPALLIGIGCLLGAQLGAAINHKTPSPVLKGMFGALFVWVALRFIASGLWGI